MTRPTVPADVRAAREAHAAALRNGNGDTTAMQADLAAADRVRAEGAGDVVERFKGISPGRWETHAGMIRACGDEVCWSIAEMKTPYRYGIGLSRGYREQEANARLIAAAPDLLALITTLRASLDTAQAERDAARETALREAAAVARDRMAACNSGEQRTVCDAIGAAIGAIPLPGEKEPGA
jgi:hypothetical protein